MSPENLDSLNIHEQKRNPEDIQGLLNDIGDFSAYNETEDDLTDTEKEINEKLGTIGNQAKYIKTLLAQITDMNNSGEKQKPSKLSNKEINLELVYIWDNGKEKSKGKEIDIYSINEKIKSRQLQISLIEKNYPELSKAPFVSDTHIRAFNEENGEYVISAEELKIQLSEGGIEGNSYLEMMRYLKWIEKTEGNENLTRYLHEVLDYILNPDDYDENEYEEEVQILKKHLPDNFLENGNLKKFAESYNIKINEFNIQRAYEAENEDETNMGELELIIDNLIENLGEKRAKELMQQCVKVGLNREESIIFLSQYSSTLKTEIETYKIEHKEYYETKKIKENGNDKINEEKLKNENNNFILTTEDSYIQTGNGFQIKGKNGEPIAGLVISQEEKQQTLGNPEATENLINFYEFFKDLNLLGVWKYRKELATAMGTMEINPEDGDSMKDEELRKFGNKLLAFISDGKGKSTNFSTLSALNEELRKFSEAGSIFSDGKTFNTEGEDKFTSYLRSRGIIGGAYFKINKFRQYL